jgi:hypothetical protein
VWIVLIQTVFVVLPVLGGTVMILSLRPSWRRSIPVVAPVALGAGCLLAAALLVPQLPPTDLVEVLVGRVSWWLLAGTVLAFAVAAASFAVERQLARRPVRRVTSTDPGALPVSLQAVALPGRDESIRGVADIARRPALFALITAWTVGTEELLYRGMALLVPTTVGVIGIGAALAIQAFFYAFNHVPFGAAAVVGKVCLGAGLGVAAVLAASIVPALLAHTAYQVLVWRQFASGRPTLQGSPA